MEGPQFRINWALTRPLPKVTVWIRDTGFGRSTVFLCLRLVTPMKTMQIMTRVGQPGTHG